MKLSSLVRNECANHRRTGTCLFSGEKCPLTAAEPKPCPLSLACSRGEIPGPTDGDYFSRSVLPLATKMPEYADAVSEYAAVVGTRTGTAAALVTIRYCACGKPRERRKQFCPTCAKQHRRETHTRQYRKTKGGSTTM